MRLPRRLVPFFGALLLAACGGGGDGDSDFAIENDVMSTEVATDTVADAEPSLDVQPGTDLPADVVFDAEGSDASSSDVAYDTAEPPDDIAPADVAPEAELPPAVPLEGYGVITGECGVLDDDEWLLDDPFFFANHIDFGMSAFDPEALSEGGQRLIDSGTLGGSSIESEAFSYEVMYRCELAELLATEPEMVYDVAGTKKIDYLAEIDGRMVGVSVVRAFAYNPPYTLSMAQDKLTEKLEGFPSALSGVSTAQAWERAILSVIAYDQDSADVVRTAWDGLSADLRADVILVVTVTDGTDCFVYNQCRR